MLDNNEAKEHRYVERAVAEILDILPENDGLARRALRHAERLRFATPERPTMRILRLLAIAAAVGMAWVLPSPMVEATALLSGWLD